MTIMGANLLPRPIYFKDIPRRWRDLIRQCVGLLFGELRDCRIKDGAIVSVGQVIGKHTATPRPAVPADLDGRPLAQNWLSLMALCAKPELETIPLIKIESGVPVLEHTDEGRWSFDDST
jgi:hypothetical protein